MTATSGISIDISLESVKRWVAFEATQVCERQIGTFNDANKRLGSFQNEIDARVKELQEGRIPIPSEEDLFREGVDFVETYDCLYIEALKAQKLAAELQRIIEFVNPRVIVDEATMKKRGGNLTEISQLTDETYKKQIEFLKDCQGKIDTLQKKMLEEISLKTTPSVQSFRGIVRSSWYEFIASWFICGGEKPMNFTNVGDKLDEFRTEKSPLKVAAADSIAGGYPLVDITLGVLKRKVFDEVRREGDNIHWSGLNAEKELQLFERAVNEEASSLQSSSKTTILSQESLLKKAIEFIRTYDRLHAMAFRAQQFARELPRVIEFLTPRTIENEATMNAHGGQLAKVSQITDKACKGHLMSFRLATQGQVNALQERMVTQILWTTAWSLQRFCQIVDNKGKPLGIMTVDKDKLPVVPELADLQAKLDAISATDAKFPKSLPSSPAPNFSDRESSAVLDVLLPEVLESISGSHEQAAFSDRKKQEKEPLLLNG